MTVLMDSWVDSWVDSYVGSGLGSYVTALSGSGPDSSVRDDMVASRLAWLLAVSLC